MFGVWGEEFGVESVGYGVKSMEYGVWGMEYGVWSLGSGAGRLVALDLSPCVFDQAAELSEDLLDAFHDFLDVGR